MNKQTLKEYFWICKRFDRDQMESLLHNVDKSNIPEEYKHVIKKLQDYFNESNDELMEIYDEYKENQIGGISKSEQVKNFLSRNITWKNISNVIIKALNIMKRVINSSAKIIKKQALDHPEATINFIENIHNSTTKLIISKIIENENSKNQINKVFENGFKIMRETLIDISKSNNNQKGGQYDETEYDTDIDTSDLEFDQSNDESYYSDDESYYSDDDSDDIDFDDSDDYDDETSDDFY